MMEETQPLNLPADIFQAKPGEPEVQMNSQGERIELAPAQKPTLSTQEEVTTLGDTFEDVISLGDTALAQAKDGLCPPTDDTGMEHKIISCGHVLKSTHDLARWSEKTGARRVNGQESIDSVSDLAINLEPNTSNRGAGRRNANNNADPAGDIRGLFNEGGNNTNNNRNRGNRRNNNAAGGQKWQPVEGQAKSEVINCWPVLKSTHDQAQLSEKRGRRAVNKAETSGALEELALNRNAGEQQQQQKWQPQQEQQKWQPQQEQQQLQPQQESQILHSWPVLKSTHDQAMISEKRGPNAVNSTCGSEVLEELIINQGGQQQSQSSQQQNQSGQQQDQSGQQSTILHSWPVLKSTHDQAMLSEKRGANAVNPAGAAGVLEEIAQNQEAIQAGGAQGNSLQSGLDTQGGSHVQMDNNQDLTETPEQVMENLHVHV